MSAEVLHPDLLNPWQTYRQSKNLLKHTSRASHPDWYRDAIDLDRQWHVWMDGSEVYSSVYDRKSNRWMSGPALPVPSEKKENGELDLSVDERSSLHEAFNLLLSSKEYGGKTKSLGLVLHIAYEFSTAELAPEFAADGEFHEVNELLALSPSDALGDASVDTETKTRRLLPYYGALGTDRQSTAVVMGRQLKAVTDEALNYGEARNIPIIATALSAPIAALTLAPLFLDPSESGSAGHIFVLNYRKFTALAVMNGESELVLCRSLPHRSGQPYAANLGETLVKTAALVNLEDPHVHIVPMANINTEPLVEEMSAYFQQHAAMNIGFVDIGEIDLISRIPGGRAEMALGNRASLEEVFQQLPVAQSRSFVELRSRWGIQDFYGQTADERAAYPSQKDLKMLKFFGLFRGLSIIALLGILGWTGFGGIRAITSDFWGLDDIEVKTASAQVEKLTKESKQISHYENLLAKRSEGWLATEAMLQLFPGPESGLVVTKCDYDVATENPQKKSQKTLAFNRTWSIEGYARSSSRDALSQLSSTRYIQDQFKELAESTGAESLQPNDDTRIITVNMQQRQGRLPVSARFPAEVAREFSTYFQITIRQNFSADDDLALNVKVPKLTPVPVIP